MKSLPKGKNEWEIKSEKLVYENDWISVLHHEVIDPGGGDGVYGVVNFKNTAVGIIPIDEQGNITLVGQFRFSLNQYSWEIPEGGCPKNEDPLDAARRELKEETGLISSDWSKAIEMDLSNSATNERAILYLATNCKLTKANPDPTESLQMIQMPVDEFFDRVMSGEIRDAITVTAALWLKNHYTFNNKDE